MSNRHRFLAFFALATPFVAAAQQPDTDEVGLVRAATEYYRDVRLKGPIVVDPTWQLYRGPMVSESVVDRVAQTTQLTKGKLTEYLQCRDEVVGVRREQICEMRGDARAVIAFMDVSISNDTATLTAVYRAAPVNGRSVGAEEVLTLVKVAAGKWKVDRVQQVGGS